MFTSIHTIWLLHSRRGNSTPNRVSKATNGFLSAHSRQFWVFFCSNSNPRSGKRGW
jgi:hypothetical protein